MFYIKDDTIRYNRIKKIVFTINGAAAMFDDGSCACKDYTVSLDQLFATAEELKEYMNNEQIL